jgi:hypothetical protein
VGWYDVRGRIGIVLHFFCMRMRETKDKIPRLRIFAQLSCLCSPPPCCPLFRFRALKASHDSSKIVKQSKRSPPCFHSHQSTSNLPDPALDAKSMWHNTRLSRRQICRITSPSLSQSMWMGEPPNYCFRIGVAVA